MARTGVTGIFIIAAIVAIASVVGLTIAAKSKAVFDTMALSTAANTAMSNTISVIFGSWPLSGLIVLAMFGAAAIGAFAYFKLS